MTGNLDTKVTDSHRTGLVVVSRTGSRFEQEEQPWSLTIWLGQKVDLSGSNVDIEGETRMLHWTWKSIISAGLLVATTTGCSSLPTTTVRGQSPDQAQLLIHEEAGWKPTESEIQQVNGVKRADTRLNGELKGVIKNNLNEFDVSRHGYRTPVTPDAYGSMMSPVAYGGTSPYARWGSFDQYPAPNGPYAGFSQCPPYHQEECWDHGGRRHKGQYHYHTYRYKAPNCLVYPAPNQPAGVVTYPYYTHKGPSDFFMK